VLTEAKKQILLEEFQDFTPGPGFSGARFKSRELNQFYVHINGQGKAVKAEEETEEGTIWYKL
jgi:hypothetical protein